MAVSKVYREQRKKMKRWLIALIIPLFAACNNIVEIEGVIKVKGSTPHTYLVIEDSKTNQDYQIIDAKKYHLDQKQNQKVKLKVKVVKKATGAGFPAIIEILELK